MGWKAIMSTLNYHSVPRKLQMHECSFEGGKTAHSDADADGVHVSNLLYPTGKYKLVS